MSDQHTNAQSTPNQLREATPQERTQITSDLMEQIIARTIQQVESRAARPSPFDLRTFEDIENFAERVTKSNLCPKDYRNKPDDAIIAILKGKEIGLPAMASLESIAVVNGRPSLWGEAVPGLCMQTGLVEDVIERFEGDFPTPDFSAVCIVKRRGLTAREGRFSLGDVGRAALANVHKQYPKDMLMWRARHRAWHGAFPDVLKGLATAEIEAELASQPQWEMPRPERSWAIPKPKKRGDAWDDAWFDSVARALFDEQNAWRWLELLCAKLAEAPTLRDVDEIEALQVVVKVVANAPEEAKARIDEAFAEARRRLTPDSEKPKPASMGEADVKPRTEPAAASTAAKPAKAEQTAAPKEQPPAAQETPAFEYVLLDQHGEPVDGVFYDSPIAWARAFAALADPRSMAYMNLREHNADAIADARQDPQAAQVIDAVEAQADIASAQEAEGKDQQHEAREPLVILPTVNRGKADWPQYIRDLTTALADESASSLAGFVAAQREQAAKFPQSVRLQASKLVAERAEALGIESPPGFTAPAPATAAAATTDSTEEAKQTTSQDDKDQAIARGILEHLDTLKDANSIRLYSNTAAVMTPLARWEREGKTDLVTTVKSAFIGRTDLLAKEKAGG